MREVLGSVEGLVDIERCPRMEADDGRKPDVVELDVSRRLGAWRELGA